MSTSRRSLLAGAAALPLAAVPVVALAAPGGDDAELIRLGAIMQRSQDRYLELALRQDRIVPITITRDIDEEITRLVSLNHDLAEQIADLRATTMAGLRVKAAALLRYAEYDIDDNPSYTNKDELLGWSLARDLAGDEAARSPERQAKWQPLMAELDRLDEAGA